MARVKKPKVQIKRQKTSLGWAYRIYIDGMYMATGLTQASARRRAAKTLHQKAGRRSLLAECTAPRAALVITVKREIEARLQRPRAI